MCGKRMMWIFTAALFVLVAGSYVAHAADEPQAAGTSNPVNACGWTNMRFAEFLAAKYGVMLADENMAQADKYNALANALSEKGIPYFSGAVAGDKVTCCATAGVLCAAVGAAEPGGTCDLQIKYLIDKGFLKPIPGSDPCDTLCNIDQAFVVAEPFSPPERRREDHPPDVPPEHPSSRIF